MVLVGVGVALRVRSLVAMPGYRAQSAGRSTAPDMVSVGIDFGGASPHKSRHCPCWRQRGDFVWVQGAYPPGRSRVGGVPEWLKGTDCKSVGFAYAGSNPAPSTTMLRDGWPRTVSGAAG